jgi:hypothetical protein
VRLEQHFAHKRLSARRGGAHAWDARRTREGAGGGAEQGADGNGAELALAERWARLLRARAGGPTWPPPAAHGR